MVPLPRVEAMPPIEASAPGSTENIRPVARSSVLSCLRVTPGCTTAMKSSGRISTIAFISRVSSEMPPLTGIVWPSIDEPMPKGTTGTPCVGAGADDRLHLFLRLRKGDGVGHVRRQPRRVVAVVLAHRDRTVARRSPSSGFSASMTRAGVAPAQM